ncbi:hypothetical protein [Fervidibacillus albus]|uniref:Uncharacterized protein n=1 Tax=Fervidibacillus albus TaxID=2980026 RepID=A0A9E8RYA0_9BACI|nr:hypothetical protein [Fervidibacillus albus]WAA10412.1 hypothetical protein OE104_03520 [Fervidibacillus albus]
MKTIGTNESSHPLKSYIRSTHYVFMDGQMIPLQLKNGHTYTIKSLKISMSTKKLEGDDFLSRISIKNEERTTVPVKLYVENDLQPSDHHYGFVSPVENVLFFTNDEGLFLTSGIFKNRPFNQYGIMKKGQSIETISDGKIPFSPIAGGDVIGIYAFEQELAPLETAIAYTWILISKTMSERGLLVKDKQLKQTLAFSQEK